MTSFRIRINLSTKKVLLLALVIQITLLGLLGLERLGIVILSIRHVIGFLYLCLVPGFLILRILRLHANIIETFLYSIGLSLSFIMFCGVLINFLYPLLGVSRPISEISVIVSFVTITLALSILSYLRGEENSITLSINLREVFSPSIISLLVLLLLVIIGTYLTNFYNFNTLLLLSLLGISTLFALAAFHKMREEVNPIIVWVIAVSLLLHTSLASPYIIDYDLHGEYYLANLVLMKGFWDATIPNNINAMLSIVMIAPTLSVVCDAHLEVIFKLFYPLIFSLVPVGLYYSFRNTFNDAIALFSCFFFVSITPFFTEMLGLARQQIASFFLVLIVLLMVNKYITRTKRTLLLTIFLFSLAMSHYGLTYIVMFSLPLVFLLSLRMKNQMHRTTYETVLATPVTISLFTVYAITWYTNFSSSSTFNTIVRLGHHIMNSLNELFSPSAVGGLEYLTMKFPLAQQISRLLYLAYNSFITIGIINLLHRRKLDDEYKIFSVISLGWCLASIIVPYIAHGRASIGLTRLYITMLFFLAPYCISGAMTIFSYFFTKIESLKKISKKVIENISLKTFAVSLTIFLLLNSGFISEIITRDFRTNPAISRKSIIENGSVSEKNTFYGLYPMEQDVFSARWLSQNKREDSTIYADVRATYNVLTSYGMMGTPELNPNLRVLRNGTQVIGNAYIYMRYFNNVCRAISGGLAPDLWWNFTEVFSLDPDIMWNKIYSNGGSVIYYQGS